jgi:hypothetical protein
LYHYNPLARLSILCQLLEKDIAFTIIDGRDKDIEIEVSKAIVKDDGC